MKELLLVLLVIIAIITIQTQRLRNAVIFLGVFSLTIAFVYLLQGAPDVAIAEAVIGSTMATILYFVALQKYKLLKVYIEVDEPITDDRIYKNKIYTDLINTIDIFCAKNNLESMPIYTVDLSDLDPTHHHVIIRHKKDKFELQYQSEYLKANDLYNYLCENYQDTEISRKVVE
jgi:uncharacterized MnhB-related membrane protein